MDAMLLCGRADGVLRNRFNFQEPDSVSDDSLNEYYKTLVRWKYQGYTPAYKYGVYYVLSLIEKRFPGQRKSFIETALYYTKSSNELFILNQMLDSLGVAWNRTRRSLCKAWYEDVSHPMQMLERSNIYSHSDLIRLSHVDPKRDVENEWKAELYKALLNMPYDDWQLPVEALVVLKQNSYSTSAITDAINNGLSFRLLNEPAKWMRSIISASLRNFDTDCLREVRAIEDDDDDVLFMEQNIPSFARKLNPLQCLVISRNARSDKMKDVLKRISSFHDQGALSFRLTINETGFSLEEIQTITDVLKQFGEISSHGEISILIGKHNNEYDVAFTKDVTTTGRSLTLGMRPSNYKVFESFLSAIM